MPKITRDKITAANSTTSEGALRLLGKLPDNYDLLSDKEKQKIRESKLRDLKRLESEIGLIRFKTDNTGFKYLKSQCERFYEQAAMGEIRL